MIRAIIFFLNFRKQILTLNTVRKLTTFILATFICAGLFAQQPYNQLSEGGTPWSFKHTEADQQLSFISLPFVNNQALLDEDAQFENDKSRRFRFGYDHYVAYNLSNSGTWTDMPDGGRIWRLAIQSTGALELSFAFKSLYLPEGSKLFIMNYDRTEKHGAFTQKYVSADHIMPTELLTGDKAIIELYVPASGISTASLELYRVTHTYRSISGMVDRSFGQSGSCQNNVKCFMPGAYDDQIRSVCCLVDGGEFCTGSLINNTCNDATPYVLTANHCYSNPSSWTFRFNWQSSTCSNPGVSPSTSNSLTGGTLRAKNAGSDFCLIQINSAVPTGYSAFWSGWDRNNTAPVNQYCIHHPSGDIKKISFATGTGVSTTWSSAEVWKTGTWTDGVTEPGSSGSPLFNMNGLIIGQLYGGPSACQYENNAANGFDYYGKLYTSWTGGGTSSTRLSDWLDPSSCNTGVTTLPGYDPNAVSVQWDAQIQSVTTPSGTYCTSSFTPVVVLRNSGSSTITSVTISYQIDANTPQTYSWSGSLTSGSTTNVTLSSMTAGAGAHTFTASTSSPNGNADQNTANDASTSNFTINTSGTTVNPSFTEGFEGSFLPANWSSVNGGGNTFWTQASVGNNSSKSASFDNYNDDLTGDQDDMLTPMLDVSALTSGLTLTFDVAYARYNSNPTYSDTLQVLVSTNCGSTWTSVYLKGGSTLSTASATTSAFTPSGSSDWRNETVNLSAYSGATGLQIAFRNRSGYGQIMYVDNINLSGVNTTGTEQNDLGSMVNVYPNPTSDIVQINTYTDQAYGVQIMNLLGEVLMTSNVQSGGYTQVDVSGLAAGMYLVKITSGKQETTKRIMVIK